MPLIGKNADCFFAFHRTGGPHQASRQGTRSQLQHGAVQWGLGAAPPTSRMPSLPLAGRTFLQKGSLFALLARFVPRRFPCP